MKVLDEDWTELSSEDIDRACGDFRKIAAEMVVFVGEVLGKKVKEREDACERAKVAREESERLDGHCGGILGMNV